MGYTLNVTSKKNSNIQISFDDVTKYFDMKNVSSICKECGESNLSINVTDKDFVHIVNMNIANIEDKHYSTLNIECDNCHHIKFFNSMSIAKDILKMKEKGEL